MEFTSFAMLKFGHWGAPIPGIKNGIISTMQFNTMFEVPACKYKWCVGV